MSKNKRNVSETAMMEYIRETPSSLTNILKNKKEILKPVFDNVKDIDLDQIIITGSGTSYHGGYAAKSLIERLTKIPCEAYYPIPFVDAEKIVSDKTLIIGISQGGESLSTVKALNYGTENGAITASLTANDDGNRVSEAAKYQLELSCGPEYAGPKTKGYQATMLILMLLGLELALYKGTISQSEYDDNIKRIEKTVANQTRIIDTTIEWYERNAFELKGANRILLVGYGNNYANVLEGRLKIQEAVRYGVEGYELEEFMHGIYHSIDEKVFLFYLVPEGDTKKRGVRLAEFLKDYTPFHYLIGNVEEKKRNLSNVFVDDKDYSVFEYILPLQLIAYLLSKDLGINPNIPKIEGFHYLMGSK
ncbi:MAG: SIS domain-containing protein [Erysipelotrichaceae bacterium]